MEPEPFEPEHFAQLAGAAPWVRRVVSLAEIDSTNAEALRLAAAGEPAGLVVVADRQTAGRGRLGRSWWSGAGTSLLASWLLRPSLPVDQWPLLTLLTGVAAARAASVAGGVTVRLKWPNDLLAPGGKLGGILAESDGRGAVVIGVGINVRQTEFPAELLGVATSLVAEGGRVPDRAWLLAALLSSFGGRMDSPGDAIEEYRSLCTTIGRRVRVERTSAEPIEGTAAGVSDAGALIVDTPSGRVAVSAGDVVHTRDAAAAD